MIQDNDGIRRLEKRLRAGLENIMPGPYRATNLRESRPGFMEIDILGDDSRWSVLIGKAVATTNAMYDHIQGASKLQATAQHFANCSPENIRALLDALRTAIAERDEARAERAIVAEHVRKLIPEGQDKSQADSPYGIIGCIVHFRERAEAAEARLEDAGRIVTANWCGRYWRGVNSDQADEVNAFLQSLGGEDAR